MQIKKAIGRLQKKGKTLFHKISLTNLDKILNNKQVNNKKNSCKTNFAGGSIISSLIRFYSAFSLSSSTGASAGAGAASTGLSTFTSSLETFTVTFTEAGCA